MRALTEAGADVNKAMDEGDSPLYNAADRGHQAVVRVLVQAGADINKAMDDDATPLFIAAQEGHEAVVRALIEAGADVGVAAAGRHCSSLLKWATRRLFRFSGIPARCYDGNAGVYCSQPVRKRTAHAMCTCSGERE